MKKPRFESAIVQIICSIVIAISTSCNSHNSELSDDQKIVISNEIESLVKNFFSPSGVTYENHTGLRANQDGYVMGGDGKILFTDYSSYNEGVKSVFAQIQKYIEFETVAMYTYVLSTESATCTAEFKSRYLTTAGDTLTNNGCWTFVFKKFDGDWKVIQENGTHLRE